MINALPPVLDRRATIKPKQSLSVVVSCFFLMIGLSWQVGAYDEDHLKNLATVLGTLEEKGLTLKKEKCKFFMKEIKNLGHIISKEGIRVDPDKYDAISNAPAPKNVKELQGFIGGINYYSKFIPKMAQICKPLYKNFYKKMLFGIGILINRQRSKC